MDRVNARPETVYACRTLKKWRVFVVSVLVGKPIPDRQLQYRKTPYESVVAAKSYVKMQERRCARDAMQSVLSLVMTVSPLFVFGNHLLPVHKITA